MSVTVRMPQLGETVTEGTILRWAKQPGDPIAEDEVLLEVSTDKVDTEVPSPTAGVVLEILVPAGETVPVGTPLAVIGAAAEMPAAGRRPGAQPAATMVPISDTPPAAAQVPLPESPAAAVVPPDRRSGVRRLPSRQRRQPEPAPAPEPRGAGARRRLPSAGDRPLARPAGPEPVAPAAAARPTWASSRRWCASSPPRTASTCRPSRARAAMAASPARTCRRSSTPGREARRRRRNRPPRPGGRARPRRRRAELRRSRWRRSRCRWWRSCPAAAGQPRRCRRRPRKAEEELTEEEPSGEPRRGRGGRGELEESRPRAPALPRRVGLGRGLEALIPTRRGRPVAPGCSRWRPCAPPVPVLRRPVAPAPAAPAPAAAGAPRRPRRRGSRCAPVTGSRIPAGCGCASPSTWWPTAAPRPTCGPRWRPTSRWWSGCAAATWRPSRRRRASPSPTCPSSPGRRSMPSTPSRWSTPPSTWRRRSRCCTGWSTSASPWTWTSAA